MPRQALGRSPIVSEARARLKIARDAEGENRSDAKEALEFVAGKQWPTDIETARKLDRRPCLTVDKTSAFVRSVCNNMRQQRPRIKVHPVADGADEVTAKVIQGLIRHIEASSNADYAYDTAGEHQVQMGWGYFRLITKYTSEDSFDQDIAFEAIENPFTVYFDPSSTAPDGSDAQWCLITQRINNDEFEKLYPKARKVSINDLGAGDDLAEWADGLKTTIAEYYRIEDKEDELALLSTGAQIFTSDPKYEALLKAGVTVVRTRKSFRRQVKWSKITALEELESRDIPGKHVPVFPIYGIRLFMDGKVAKRGMVKALMDPQRMYNFWRTSETEMVALAPKAPWLMAEGQDEGREDEWNAANSKNFSSLKYKPVTVATAQGEIPLPPPMRQQPQAIPAASVNAAMGASEDMKAVAGMFDPALGAEGNETSGEMVSRRQQQSDLSNFHFYDNQTRTIRHAGKVCLEWIPTIYDTQRVVRILGDDGAPSSVTLNDAGIDKVLHDMTVGTYDVVMETGPGYQTKREEAFEFMLEMGKAYPPLFQAAGDLIMRQSDNPGASDIADRLAAMNPIASQIKQLPQDMDPKAKTIVVGLMGRVQQLQGQLQQLAMEKQAKVFGVQEREQAVTERTAMQEQEESQRQARRESAETHRTVLQIAGKLHDTHMKDHTSLTETLIDAHTDLEIARRQAMNHGKPDGART